jgi:hypothetical protein
MLHRTILWMGALIGGTLAVGLGWWRHASYAAVPPTGAEGVWFDAIVYAVAIGFPLNLLLGFPFEPVAIILSALGIDPFYLLLAGIVANWWLIAYGTCKLLTRSRA